MKQFGSSEAIPCWITSTPLAVDSLSVKQRNVIVRVRKVNSVCGMNHFQKLCMKSIDIVIQTVFPIVNQQGMMKSSVVNKKNILILDFDRWCHGIGVTVELQLFSVQKWQSSGYFPWLQFGQTASSATTATSGHLVIGCWMFNPKLLDS